jgi:hypothetical protein
MYKNGRAHNVSKILHSISYRGNSLQLFCILQWIHHSIQHGDLDDDRDSVQL